MNVIVVLTAGMLVVLLLILAAGCLVAWYSRPPTGGRVAAVRSEALLAEARIDAMTRQTMQRMRDVVRDEQRGRRYGGEVIEGDIIE